MDLLTVVRWEAPAKSFRREARVERDKFLEILGNVVSNVNSSTIFQADCTGLFGYQAEDDIGVGDKKRYLDCGRKVPLADSHGS